MHPATEPYSSLSPPISLFVCAELSNLTHGSLQLISSISTGEVKNNSSSLVKMCEKIIRPEVASLLIVLHEVE